MTRHRNHGLGRLVARRLLVLPVVLVAVAAMTYLLVAVSPFDPMSAYEAGSAGLSAQAKDEIRAAWGMDAPTYLQFLHWLGNVLQGDLGHSRLLGGQPVLPQLGARLAPTAILVGTALALTLVGGLLAGVAAAAFRDSWVDRAIRGLSYVSVAAPSFWTGLLLLWVFSSWLGWFPAGGSANLRARDVGLVDPRYLVLPAIALAATQFAWFAMFVRNQLLEVMREDYVVFAQAQGIGRWPVLLRHALPNALLPFLTLAGVHLAEIVGGTILVETVFSWPGLGQLAVEAARAVDLPLLVGITLLGSVTVVLGNLLADVCYRVADPRIRESTA